jgi:hypothetical protein
MRLLETKIDISALRQYAHAVIQHGGVHEVYLVGSAVYSPTPNDIDLLYIITNDQQPKHDGDESDEELLSEYIERNTNIDLSSYDSFFKYGNQYFYLSSGAGRSMIENTDYALEQIHKGVIRLA